MIMLVIVIIIKILRSCCALYLFVVLPLASFFPLMCTCFCWGSPSMIIYFFPMCTLQMQHGQVTHNSLTRNDQHP